MVYTGDEIQIVSRWEKQLPVCGSFYFHGRDNLLPNPINTDCKLVAVCDWAKVLMALPKEYQHFRFRERKSLLWDCVRTVF